MLVLQVSEGKTRYAGIGEVPSIGWPERIRHEGHRRLEAVARLLTDQEVHLTGSSDLLDVMRQLHREASRPLDATTDPRFAQVSAALQTALLDAAARAVRQPMWRLFGSTQAAIRWLPTAVDARAGDVMRTARLAERRSRGGAVRLLIDAQEGAGRRVAVVVANLGVDNVPSLWLRLGGDPSPEDLKLVIADLSQELNRGRLPEEVVLELPRGSSLDLVLRVQRFADTARGMVRRLLGASPIRILGAPSGAVDAREFAEARRIRALALDPSALGGPIDAVDFVSSLCERRPEVRIGLLSSRGGSELSGWMVRTVAAAIPGQVLVGCGPPSHHTALSSPPLPRPSPAAPPPELPGLGVSLNLDSAAELVRAYRSWRLARSSGVGDERRGPARYGTEVERIKKWALDNHLLEREALSSGMRTVRASTQSFVADDPATSAALVFDMSVGQASSVVGRRLTVNKAYTSALLEEAGVPVPAGRAFGPEDRDAAAAFARELGFPVVVKPTGGSLGIGVTPDIRDEQQLNWALDRLTRLRYASSGILVERHVDGQDYRAFVIAGKVVSVMHRTPAAVVGDGLSTVKELVFYYNAQRLANPYLGRRPIVFDDTAYAHLEQHGLAAGDVPEKGRRVTLRSAANLAQGGQSFEVLDDTHPKVLSLLGRVTSAIPGLPTCGVDVIMEDHRRDPAEQGMSVIEINSKAELSLHQYPAYGPARNVARDIVDWYRAEVGLPVVRERPEHLTVACSVTGKVTDVGYERWLEREATRLGVEAQTRTSGRDIQVSLRGEPSSVAAAVARLLEGPGRSRASMVIVEAELGGAAWRQTE